MMSEMDAKALVVEAGHRLSAAGLVARTWGNISARISDTQFVITPSGMAYERLTPGDIVTVNIADCSYTGEVKPSSEKGIHADCYRLRPDVNFVIHTHQLYATAVGVTGKALRIRDEVLGQLVPNAKYGISSTKTLRKNVAAAVEENPGVSALFMRSHGALLLGADCESCFNAAARLEKLCREKVESTLKLPGSGDSFLLPEELTAHIKGEAVAAVSPAILAESRLKGRHLPVIDDMAQIAGVSYRCISMKPGWEKRAAAALRSDNIVFIKDRGAVCTGINADEAAAVATVAEKNCLAHLYALTESGKTRIAFPDALLQRSVYKLKYSKLK